MDEQVKYIDNSSDHYLPKSMSTQHAEEDAFRQSGFDVNGKYVEKSWIPDPDLPRGGAWRPQQ